MAGMEKRPRMGRLQAGLERWVSKPGIICGAVPWQDPLVCKLICNRFL